MKLITERTQVRDVAKQWARAYPRSGPDGKDEKSQAIAKALFALDPETASAADVAAIIGNGSWCGMEVCHDCEKVVSVAVQVGEEPDHESYTATLCRECVVKAANLIIRATNDAAAGQS